MTIFFTLRRWGIDSSTRVGSVASLGNQEEVDNYRNDSPVELLETMDLEERWCRMDWRVRWCVNDVCGM